jgi:uncharacterized protein
MPTARRPSISIRRADPIPFPLVLMRSWLIAVLLLAVAPATAQTFPALSGRVVDAANLLDAGQEAALTAKLEALESATGRQLVVATIASLEGYDEQDYGYRLGRAWGIGSAERNDGAILLVAPNERRVRIEVGYGLEPVLTDALSSVIIQTQILPRFRDGDMAGGIIAGADAMIEQLRLPEEEAQARSAQLVSAAKERERGGAGWPIIIFWIVVLLFIVVPMLFGGGRGKRHRRGRGPVVIWGPGLGGSGWGGGSGGGFGGGFGGGGGGFGGGGASGGW